MPADSDPALDGWDMLDDPGGMAGKYLNPSATTLRGLQDVACLLLLGEPGMGKTTELDREISRLRAENRVVVHVELGGYTDWQTLESELTANTGQAMAQAREDQVVLVLDGLDEAGLEIRRLADGVPRWLGNRDSSRLCLRLASRHTVARLSDLTESLGNLWSDGLQMYQLAPLTRADVEVAAEHRGFDGSVFVNQVTTRGVGYLAARPITLEMLLASASSGSALPGSRPAIYNRGIRELAKEHNLRYAESRHPNVPVGDIVAAAERLATVSLLAGRPRIVREGSPQTETDCVSLDDYPSSRIRLPHPDAVWKSALLVHHDPDTATFSHRSIAEFLAAEYLACLDYDLQRRLLADPNNLGVVTPQLGGVAEWLSYTSPDVFNWLVETNVDALLNPDLPSRSEEQHQLIVQKTIEDLKDEHAVATSRYYGGLAYEGMNNDLRPLFDSQFPWQVRLQAIMIAMDNEITGLDTQLMDIIDSAASNYSSNEYNEEVRLGAAAIRALAGTGDVTDRQHVIDLAFDVSISHHLRVAALQAAIRFLDTTELCARLDLTDPQNRDREFLGGLCDELRDALYTNSTHDPGVLVHWLSELLSNFDDVRLALQLVDVVFRFALERNDQLREDEWVQLGSSYARVLDQTGSRLLSNLQLPDRPAARRKFAINVLRHSRNPSYAADLLVQDGLIVDNDLEHWLRQYAIDLGSESTDAHLAETVVREISQPIDDHKRLVSSIAKEHPVLLPLVQDLFSPQAMTSRQIQIENASQQDAEDTAKQTDELFSFARFDSAIDKENWLQVRSELERNVAVDNPSDNVGDIPISRLPAWQQLNEAQQSRVISIAQSFLSQQIGPATAWERLDAIGTAADLLADRASGLLMQIPAESLTFWTLQIADRTNRHETCARLLSAIAKTDPHWVNNFVTERLLQQANSSFSTVIHQMGELSSDCIVDTLHELAMSDSTNPHWTLASFLAAGFERAPTRFADLCLTIMNAGPDVRPDTTTASIEHSESIPWHRAVTAAHALASSTQLPNHFDILFESLQGSTAFAADVILGSHLPKPPLFLTATSMQRARLVLWARATFPLTEIQVPGKVYSVDPLVEMADDLFRHVAGTPTPDNLAALEYIAAQTGGKYDRAAVRDMRRAIRESIWKPPSPADISEVLSDAARRIVSTDAQLQELLVDTIDDLNQIIRTDTTVRSLFWHRQLGESKMWIPCCELEFSNRFANMLRRQLQGVVVHREVELQPKLGSQKGENPDIDATVVTSDGRTLTCLIEVKGNWHDKIETDITDQLAERYLQGPGGTHGIYLVAWYEGMSWLSDDSRPSKVARRNKNQLLDSLRELAVGLNDQGVNIDVCLIDLTLERSL